jgi:hypothetical protein
MMQEQNTDVFEGKTGSIQDQKDGDVKIKGQNLAGLLFF